MTKDMVEEIIHRVYVDLDEVRIELKVESEFADK